MKREICTAKEESKNSASRIALAAKILFLSSVAIADCADCQAYKTQVVNDCDSLHSTVQSCLDDCSSISILANNGRSMNNGSTQGNDQASLLYFTSISERASSLQSTLQTLDNFVYSIKSTAQSLQCNVSSNTVGSCDCSQYLQTLIGLLQTCNQSVTGIATGLDSVKSTLGEYNDGDDLMPIVGSVNDILNYGIYTYALLENFFEYSLENGVSHNISDFYELFSDIAYSITNTTKKTGVTTGLTYNRMSNRYIISESNYDWATPFHSGSQMNASTLKDLVGLGFNKLFLSLGSLNNYNASNIYAIATIARKIDNLTNTTSNALLDYIVEVDRPPLLDSSSSDYFASLTNSYLSTWSANDNPNTNWFRRVEILLASLVFKNYDNHDSLADSATNSISSLDTARSTFVDSVNAEDLFSFDLGSEYLDSPPSLPEFGDQLPDSLIITIPRYNDSNLNSETHNDQIEISGLNQYSTIFDLVRVFFRLVWWAIVVILVFVCFKYFFAFCKFSFNLFTKFTFN